MGCDFLAIDEVQLCGDAERGHVFTDRLLHARGLHETLFLGADTMRNAIAAMVPGANFMQRERMSQLTYSGSKKLSRMPARSAIVGFSVENVYAIAELLRRQKGGAAVVMGALSPRTRNAQVEMYQNSVKRLIQTLETRTDDPWLTRVRESDDLAALKALGDDALVAARATDGPSVKLLWDVCRIPDFRGISRGEHAALLTRIYTDLHQSGHVDESWLSLQIARIDRPDGDIDMLSKRLAFIRTWTYVAQRKGWVRDESHWRDYTRAVEDRLSDALHGALTQRFVDRRTSILLRRLKQKESLVAEVNENGEVTVEGEFVGKLEGFRFRMDKAGSPDEAKTLKQASAVALAPYFNLRADKFYNAPDTEIDFTERRVRAALEPQERRNAGRDRKGLCLPPCRRLWHCAARRSRKRSQRP